MIEFSVLGSGSKGNSTFLRINGYSFLFDCGLSCKQVELRLEKIGVSPSSIDAVFLSHEHDDHIRSIHTFSKRYNVPIITSEKTFKAGRLDDKGIKDKVFVESGKTFSEFKGVDVFFIPISHDAADPVGFVVYSEGIKFALVTDLGYPTELVSHELKGADALIIESNHDPEMLKLSTKYPWELKQRIASRKGHLSNGDCARLVERVISDNTGYIVLAHLSEENNNPDIALMSVSRVVKGMPVSIDIAKQNEPTPIYSLSKVEKV
ncbi:beta-lactamase [Thermotomaculum hydrothermale]|uniref:Beta-lactamase n=1 Tax=Thermotomaculum hydrothermale TaxID=981385 RepID=A0A7R6SYM5_9BACT|nr:MBL fold metallo-hydrolase [Thermotomaculum hydrothermale]BBB32815.1 beta-lactamase [Thermotomaculum hydrothermale]